ncbi:phosphoribosylamine--glycine ligase [Halanaeroarchaeum sulfurireducens]|uniref:Phosphoribosylamine--glycine ligase n=1 Tax=Halanaeroarchaeum sulfurireducens TaxID=1604004 RepID=A0A0F7PD39_9EURY|nr:phosphoribosylamine--glycine ligase [Halanaeroarchaeum sulfurireducens]AKH98060.1 phosphoribosylamine--glycine ligase [Halanaeroarchaeum sulfurireducens]
MSDSVLLVGGGGREHAIARALADTELYACASNRNPGIARIATDVETLDETDPAAVVEYAESVGVSLAVIGPEAALEAGVVDALEDVGVYAFGPRQADARIETDKTFQREFMDENDITGTPEFATFADPDSAAEYVESVEGHVAVKPRGLTGGKGVRVTGDQLSKPEAATYIRNSDYEEWVIEERLVGEEFTVQAFVANGDVRGTPAVQDHKRAYEGDEGPNTGGMGSYSDARFALPFMTDEEYDEALGIIQETVEALEDYRGILYGQFMLTAEGLKVVEFNARFGDPEAMNTLPVLETDFLDVLGAARDGEPLPELAFAAQATVCKYAVPAGYPTDPEDGAEVAVDEESVGDGLLFYASVDERDDGIYTTTSRSFAVVGVADSIDRAERIAEDGLSDVDEGFHVRHDIGTEELVQSRIDHMAELRGE